MRTRLESGVPIDENLAVLSVVIERLRAAAIRTVNHDIYALVAIAERGIAETDTSLARDVARALGALAKDSRPGARSAAAYAMGFALNSSHDAKGRHARVP